jgi:hypothetical protein
MSINQWIWTPHFVFAVAENELLKGKEREKEGDLLRDNIENIYRII